jgi:hypothetical protein
MPCCWLLAGCLTSSHVCEAPHLGVLGDWLVAIAITSMMGMGENIAQQNIGRSPSRRKRPGRPTAEAIGRNLLNIIVYAKGCRVGDKVVLDDLAETSEVGDWMMPDFEMANWY